MDITPGPHPSASFDEELNLQLKDEDMIPSLFDNNSRYLDTQVYIAVIG
jgi:hypothetical protein